MKNLNVKSILGMLCFVAITAFTMTSCEKAVSTSEVLTSESLESLVLGNTILNPCTGEHENVDALMTDVEGLRVQRPDNVRPGRKTPPPFRCLRLTEEQRRQIGQFFKEQDDCVKPIREAYRQVLQDLKVTMDQKYREIEAYKSSPDYDRAVMLEMVKAAREYQQAELRSARARFEEATKACLDPLFRKIESILTDEQMRIWNQWKITGKGC